MKPHPRAVESALAEIERQTLTRLRRTVEGFDAAGGAEVVVEGRRLVNFCGNDYLGLAHHPEVIAALRAAAATYGVGSGASHLVTGHGREHECLEEELARFVGRERALLLSTGYMANLAAVTALAGRGDLLLLDRLSHASLIDAALLSRARLRRYPHADAPAVRRMLALESGHDRSRDGAPERVTLIATDGVFSMDGDIAPLTELAGAAAQQDAWLLVDDAHGLGVLGHGGRGTLEHLGLDATAVPLLMGTLGKAFGTFGAFLAGSHEVIELILQRARSYIYTTATPQALAAATRAALSLAQREPWRRERALALSARFRSAAREQGLPVAHSLTPIQPILLGSAEAALSASRRLLASGFWVTAIRPPTVPRNTARLRVTLSAAHTESQVDALVAALADAWRRSVPAATPRSA
ncbi:MAG TPA: 8-amino-7-oxononanoate synthase [Steroidobacteraceae bacterium]|nr:8-amino-7-oxononanoate synthase [Steroidobacteraceae bacterium]